MGKYRKMITGVILGTLCATSVNMFTSSNYVDAKRINGRTGSLTPKKTEVNEDNNNNINIQERASQYNSIASTGGGVSPWVYMYTYQPYAFYKNTVTGQWKTVQVTSTFSHTLNTMVNGWGHSIGRVNGYYVKP